MGYVTHVGMPGFVPLSMLTPLGGSPPLTRGTTSKSDHIEFELRPVFAKWTLDNVTEAITRCEQLQRSFRMLVLTMPTLYASAGGSRFTHATAASY